MQHLNTLWQIVSAASTVSEIARQQQIYRFNVDKGVSVFLRADHADVEIVRWSMPNVEVTAKLQAAFGWRIVTDQDGAGVYIVAKRKRVVGSMSSASFLLRVPHDAYMMLELEDGRVALESVSGKLHISPPDADGSAKIKIIT